MQIHRERSSGRARTLALILATTATVTLAALAIGAALGRADTITMKGGVVYRGSLDRDTTDWSVFDGLRRVIFHNTKVARRDPDANEPVPEVFKLEQPLQVHVGTMPKYILEANATPWDRHGRRTFSYVGANDEGRIGRKITMTQAINEIDPQKVRFRGVDGFWKDGLLSIDSVPRPVILGILARVNQTDLAQREKVCRFLIEAHWYAEALPELDRLIKDFNDKEVRDRARRARDLVRSLQAQEILAEIEVRRKGQQPGEVRALLKTFPTRGLGPEILKRVRDLNEQEAARAAADKAAADALSATAERLPSDVRKRVGAPLVELLQGLAGAPDATRPRLAAFEKAPAATTPENKLALALSGWALGPDKAVADLAAAEALWKARSLVFGYLRSRDEDEADRASILDELRTLELPAAAGQAARPLDLDTIDRLARHLPPPRASDHAPPTKATILRVLDDDPRNVPTEYAVQLPPDYSPWRSYPAVVALHSGRGETAKGRMLSAIAWWGPEAARRGYIVIAPEYVAGDKGVEYHHSPAEHAAAVLALRDARKRFAVDSDRVFVGGQLNGADMAWDLGLGHPDHFAGIVAISGRPFKYVFRAINDTPWMPLYLTLGTMAPGEEFIRSYIMKPYMTNNLDVVITQYISRGQEDFPEDAPAAFDWMASRRRVTDPRAFKFVSARECDDRFYGLVIRQFANGRTTPLPGAVSEKGENLNPAQVRQSVSSQLNQLSIRADGVTRLDVWISPRLVDCSKKVLIKLNNRVVFRASVKENPVDLLDDLRVRGDRQQTYWLRVPISL
ncbi:MAG TPA: alpha/beta hydrolase [Isosphaeraceae bacterium]|jgi:hypothetical protein|nr:alpha/beta hydrolase [Isosphaeraceae bacterium]